MAADDLEDVTGKEWCPACGLHHEVTNGQLVAPVLCANLLMLTRALRSWVESGDDDETEALLLEACDEVLGEEGVEEDEEEDEVFK